MHAVCAGIDVAHWTFVSWKHVREVEHVVDQGVENAVLPSLYIFYHNTFCFGIPFVLGSYSPTGRLFRENMYVGLYNQGVDYAQCCRHCNLYLLFYK